MRRRLGVACTALIVLVIALAAIGGAAWGGAKGGAASDQMTQSSELASSSTTLPVVFQNGKTADAQVVEAEEAGSQSASPEQAADPCG